MTRTTSRGQACAQAAFREAFARDPLAPAFAGGGADLTYADVEAQTARVGGALVAARGDRLEPAVLLARDSLAYARAGVGAVRAGRTIVPLDPGHPPERLRASVDALGACAVLVSVGDERLARSLARPSDDVIVIEQALEAPPLDGWLDRDPQTPYRITFTSGSTGRPKGVPRNHAAARGAMPDDTARPVPGDRVAVTFSGTRAGVGNDPLRILLASATILPFRLREEGIGRFARFLLEYAPTVVEAVPTVLRHLAAALPEDAVLRDVRLVRTGGESLYWTDVARLRDHLPASAVLWITYGATEAGAITTYRVPDPGEREGLVPVGTPAPGVAVRVVDGEGRDVEPGEAGVVVVSGHRVTPGYTGTESPERFGVDGDGVPYFWTGDLGRLDPATGVLTHLGREDGMVKIHGQRVELAAVEAAVCSHPAVRECCVLDVVGRAGDRELVAFVGGVHVRDAEVIAHLRDRVPAASVPSHVVVLDQLPRLAAGKTDRVRLRQSWEQRRTATSAFPDEHAFADEIELMIAATVQRFAATSVPDRSASLLDLGVDSIHLAALFVELDRRYGVDLPVSTVLEAPSVAALAERVRENDPVWPPVVPVRPHGQRPPLVVVHGGAGNVLFAWPLAELLDPDQPVYAIQYPGIDGRVPPEDTIAGLAERYVEELLDAVPGGPYRLMGMSVGGVIAFEMAAILRERGLPVEVVVLLDSTAPPSGAGRTSPNGSSRVRRRRGLGERLARHARVRRHTDAGTFLRHLVRTAVEWGPYQVRVRGIDRDLTREGRVRPAYRYTFTMGLLGRLAAGHVPTAVDVPVMLLRSTATLDDRTDRGWSAFAEVEVHDAVGAHDAILLPPNLEPNADVIRDVLMSLDRRSDPTGA